MKTILEISQELDMSKMDALEMENYKIRAIN